MTGNYPWRGRLENGTWMFHQRSQILDGQTTLGQLMRGAGYETAFLGKVHLGGTVFSATTRNPSHGNMITVTSTSAENGKMGHLI